MPKKVDEDKILKAYNEDPTMGYSALSKVTGISYTAVRNFFIRNNMKEEFESKTVSNPTRFMSREDIEKRQYSIAKSRRERGTNKHRIETKEKISKSIKDRWDKQPWDTSSKNNIKNHITGTYKGIYYRSSYELKFIKLCEENNINIDSCDNQKINFEYMKSNGKKGLYRPDFVDLDTNTIYEVKPESMLTYGENLNKIRQSGVTLITEKDLNL